MQTACWKTLSLKLTLWRHTPDVITTSKEKSFDLGECLRLVSTRTCMTSAATLDELMCKKQRLLPILLVVELVGTTSKRIHFDLLACIWCRCLFEEACRPRCSTKRILRAVHDKERKVHRWQKRQCLDRACEHGAYKCKIDLPAPIKCVFFRGVHCWLVSCQICAFDGIEGERRSTARQTAFQQLRAAIQYSFR